MRLVSSLVLIGESRGIYAGRQAGRQAGGEYFPFVVAQCLQSCCGAGWGGVDNAFVCTTSHRDRR